MYVRNLWNVKSKWQLNLLFYECRIPNSWSFYLQITSVYIYGNIEKLSTTITYNFHKQLHFVINLFSVEAMCKGIIYCICRILHTTISNWIRKRSCLIQNILLILSEHSRLTILKVQNSPTNFQGLQDCKICMY